MRKTFAEKIITQYILDRCSVKNVKNGKKQA